MHQRRLWIPLRQQLVLACTVVSAVMAGSSCNRESKLPSGTTTVGPSASQNRLEGEQTAESQSEPTPSKWVIVDWAAKGLTDSPPDSEAELQTVDQGLQVTTHERRGAVHVVLRDELLDEFEVTCRIVQPSVAELQAEGMPRPSPFASLVGFRSVDGRLNLRTHLKRDRMVRATFDVVLRGSKQQIQFTINGQPQQVVPRHRLEPGHFFLEFPKNNRAYIASVAVRTGLEPDPALMAAADRMQTAPNGNRMREPPSFFDSMPPMFGPGLPGMMRPDSSGELPAPSRLEPLMTRGDWFVPKLGNATLDTSIAKDLRLETSNDSVIVAKTTASGGFWLIRKIKRDGDFTASCQLSIPSMVELSAIADPTTFLAVGMYPLDESQQQAISQAPPPQPNGPREFKIEIRRSSGRATLDVAGMPVGGSVTTDGGLLLGLYLRGGIRFSIHQFDILPPANDMSSGKSVAESSQTDSRRPKPPVTRVWTESNGMRQIEATFIQLEAEQVLLRRKDGKEYWVPLDGLSRSDQEVAQRLSEQ
jgi:hypothetical protein